VCDGTQLDSTLAVRTGLAVLPLWQCAEQEPQPDSFSGHRAAIFAHEVANTLGVIGFSIEFLKSEFASRNIEDPMVNKVVQSALEEIAGLGSLLHEHCAPTLPQLFDFEIADLGQLVEEVLVLQSLACRAAGVVVKFERESAAAWVRLDALKIKQVITNLCKNANEAMPRGGHLNLKVYRSGQLMVLEVSDTGAGVAGGVDVFEPFASTKAGGRGLGLPLAREIVSAHRGAIAFTSEPGRGATFKVSLPSCQSHGRQGPAVLAPTEGLS